jgi:flagellar hook-length control protein FliK
MTISLVSAVASSGNPLAAPAGDAVAGDIFSILFQQFLAGAGEAREIDGALPKAIDLFATLDTSDMPAVLAQLESSPEASGLGLATLLGQADAAVLSQLPEEIQSLLRDIKKRLSQEEKEETRISLLGALSTPVELPRETVATLGASTKAKADPYFMPLMQQMGGLSELEKAAAELLPSRSVNLAAGAEDFSQFLRENLLLGQARHSAASAQSVGGQGLQTPVMSPAWAREFGEKIVWMAKSGQQLAQLSLNPAHLGPLSIILNLEADKASATFTATSPEVRQAIEEAMPRLREMLAAAGVALGETSVGTQTRQEWQTAQQQAAAQQDAENATRRNARETRGNGDGADGAILDDHSSTTRVLQTRHGASIVDLFA